MGHHYVPQRYLRNFEDPERPRMIWMHEKRGGEPRIAPIEKVAQSREFYSEETEKLLANAVEAPGSNVIDKLLKTQDISPAERLQLAMYIGTMLKRVPAHRRVARAMVPDALAAVVANLREELQALSSEIQVDPELVARRLREIEAAEEKYSRQPPSAVLEQIERPWPTEPVVKAIFEMTWRVVETSGSQRFLTSDNPVFFFRWLGLTRPESELSFPLSTSHALHGSWQGPRSGLLFLSVEQQTVEELNRRTVTETERFTFYQQPAPWVRSILPKNEPRLNRIMWNL